MAVKHSKVTAVPDDPAFDVGSDEWNAAHTIDAGTITSDQVAPLTGTPWVNVKDPAFGAVGDGVTNDSTAIQAAIDSLPHTAGNQGGRVLFPPGSYLLNSGLVTAINNLELYGIGGRGQSRGLGGAGPPLQSGRTVISVADGITGLTWGTSGTYLARGPVMRNIHFEAFSASAATDTRALLMYQPSNWLIDNCSFSGFNWSIAPATITGISYAGTTTTVTTSAAHNFRVGDLVQIKGVVMSPAKPNGANGCWKITGVTSNTFAYTQATNPGTWSSGGTACVLGMATLITPGGAGQNATAYGTFSNCTWASANGMGGAWTDSVNGVKYMTCLFDGNNNALTVATNGVGLANTGGGDNIRAVACEFQAYQTLVDMTGGYGHELVAGRYEGFGTAWNILAPNSQLSGGEITNGGAGSGGTACIVGTGGNNVTFFPASIRGTGTDFTVTDNTAATTFRAMDHNGALVMGNPSALGQLTVKSRTNSIAGLALQANSASGSDVLLVSNNSGVNKFRINFAGNPIIKNTTAPADGDLNNSEVAVYLDDTAGTPVVKFKAKDSGGTVANNPALGPHHTTHEVGGADAVTVTHAQTTGQTANDHHAQAHTNTDHTTTGTPGSSALGDAAAQGSSASVARLDHVHGREAAAITTSGHTQATGKMLGRSTAATGAIEEITVGSGLSLSAGSLTATGGGGVASDTIWDTKGDIAAATGADAAAKLPAGADDTILMADSAQTTGLKWVASATPSTQAFGDAAAVGTADTFTRGDHKHAMPANPAPSFATPAIVLGSSAAAGAAGTVIRSDGTIAAFDATNPTTQALNDAAAVGTAAFAARRDHKHAMFANSAVSFASLGDIQLVTLANDFNFTTSSTTLQDITGFSFSISSSATEVWLWEVFGLVAAANITMDAKFGMSGPTGATASWGAFGTPANNIQGFGTANVGNTPLGILAIGGTMLIGTLNGTTGAGFGGFAFGGGTGGTIQIRGAQNTIDAGQLTLKKYSVLRATRIAT